MNTDRLTDEQMANWKICASNCSSQLFDDFKDHRVNNHSWFQRKISPFLSSFCIPCPAWGWMQSDGSWLLVPPQATIHGPPLKGMSCYIYEVNPTDVVIKEEK